MRRADVVFRVRGVRLTDIDPDDTAAFLSACAKLLGRCRLVRLNAHTVVLRRLDSMQVTPIIATEKPAP